MCSDLWSNMADLVYFRGVRCYEARENSQIEDFKILCRFEEKKSIGYRTIF